MTAWENDPIDDPDVFVPSMSDNEMALIADHFFVHFVASEDDEDGAS